MSDDVNIIEGRQTLERLTRQGSEQAQEVSVVTSPGTRAAAWAVKVKSNFSYNAYNVVAVVIGDAGTVPVEIGAQTQAVNLAESFLQQGNLAAGTYAVMFRVGDKNVFYVKP
ncbi:MAG: hypothetical protein H8D56_21760 [Planctomycetes bacterium]|nr:hypothetical protein [Planctomycetota bacterium]MBL7143230.1 hypothetical protein [Phycisphaerae bacterium]